MLQVLRPTKESPFAPLGAAFRGLGGAKAAPRKANSISPYISNFLVPRGDIVATRRRQQKSRAEAALVID